MHSQGAHIVTRCQWNTAFDSKSLAHQLQTDISSWSAYKMKRVMNSVFDSICPKGQTLKIKKLAVDLGAITYENLLSELPLRLEEALRTALYELILYPKNGDKTLEIVHEDVAQINVLRDFLLQGILPWNHQETYGTAIQIMRLQLLNNRLDLIQMIQEIGVSANVRKRIAWQFPEVVIKKIIKGLEPNNHQQIINFSDEFIKIQEKETIVQTSTNDLKKNIWLWILNYLFTERGTIFNRIAFVKSTVTQMASHFNLSYDAMIELIESAIERAGEYSQVDKGFIVILKLLSDEVRNTAFSRIKTVKQKENYWAKVETYFNRASARSTNEQKNEFNELVINLSKLDATRFQRIMLNVEQKPNTWKGIVQDLIPAAVENLFLALSPSKSKNILKQISFLAKLPQTSQVNIDILDLYTFGIEFCVTHQNTSVAKTAFLDFITEKLAQQQQQSKLIILDHFVSANVTHTQKKTSFISLFKELNSLYQQEITNTKTFTSEAELHQILVRYASEIQQTSSTTNTIKTLEKTIQKWIAASPMRFWTVVQSLEKTPTLNAHIAVLISAYGTKRFLKATQLEAYTVLTKVQQILDVLISKNPKKASVLRAIKNELFAVGFEVVWKQSQVSTATFFAQLLQAITQESRLRIATKEVQEAIQLLLQTSKIRTLSWSAREFVSIQKQYNKQLTQTPLETVLMLTQEANQQVAVGKQLLKVVRTKKITTGEFKQNEKTFISYLIYNGVQLQKSLIERFEKELSIAKTTYSSSEVKRILQELFWQILVAYESHRGDENRFISLFEKTVLHAFPVLDNKPATSFKSIENLQTLNQLSVEVLLEAIRSNLQSTTARVAIGQKTYSFSKLFAIGLEKEPATIRKILQESTISATQLRFLKKQLSFESFIAAQIQIATSTESKIFKGIQTLFQIVQQYGNSQVMTDLQTIFWKQTIALIQGKQAAEKTLKTLVEITFEKLSKIATVDQIAIIKDLQQKNVTVSKLLDTMVQAFPVSESKSQIETSALFEAIRSNIQTTSASVAIGQKTYSFSELFTIGLEKDSATIHTILKEVTVSETQLRFLKEQLSFESFITAQMQYATSSYSDAFKGIYTLFRVVQQHGNSKIKTDLQAIFWKQTIALIQGKQASEKTLKMLAELVFEKLSEISSLDTTKITKDIQHKSTTVSKLFKTMLQAFPVSEEEPKKSLSATTEIKQLQTPYHISISELFEAIRSNLQTTSARVEVTQKTYTFSALFTLGLETSPATIRTMLQENQMTEKQVSFLKEHISFETFMVFHANDSTSKYSKAFKAIHALFRIAKQLGNTQILTALQTIFWKYTIALMLGKKAPKKTLKKLVEITFDKLSEIATLDQITIVKHIQNNNVAIPEILKKVLVKRHRVFELIHEKPHKISLSKAIKKHVKSGKIELLSQSLITQHKIPTWFVHKEGYSYERVLNELITQQPLVLLKTMRSQQISEVQLLKFVKTIQFDTFISALLKLYTGQQKELLDIQKLYQNISFSNMRGISTKNIQEIIIKKVVIAWRTSNWSLIASTNIWNELLWEICGKKAVQKQDFFAAINSIKTMLPTALLVTYKSVLAGEKSATENTLNKIDTKTMDNSTPTFPEEGVAIPNAGLVMLNSYFIMLLDRLGATKDNAFVSDEMQLNAVHYLQYIVTGMTETEESLLTLNKLLAGLSPTAPVKDAVEMTQDQKTLIDGMIQAAISYWPAIGETSINGFRGNWLVREGVLRETEERWELTVEKRPYDVLMIKSPFSFSIIKLPWMDKPLHVTWPF